MNALKLELDRQDVRILVQSLENCLRTCESKQQKPDAPCEDCDAARALQRKLQEALEA